MHAPKLSRAIWMAFVTLFVACQTGPAGTSNSGLPPKPESGPAPDSTHFTNWIPESLSHTSASQSQQASAASSQKPDSLPKKPRNLTALKKEPWMDTLTDLTGITPPTAATLLSEDPLPLNKNSVEILIAQLLQNPDPEELTLRIYVSESGGVLRYQLLKASSPRLGPEHIARPLLELRFNPARQGQKPVPAWTIVHFKLPKAL